MSSWVYHISLGVPHFPACTFPKLSHISRCNMLPWVYHISPECTTFPQINPPSLSVRTMSALRAWGSCILHWRRVARQFPEEPTGVLSLDQSGLSEDHAHTLQTLKHQHWHSYNMNTTWVLVQSSRLVKLRYTLLSHRSVQLNTISTSPGNIQPRCNYRSLLGTSSLPNDKTNENFVDIVHDFLFSWWNITRYYVIFDAIVVIFYLVGGI